MAIGLDEKKAIVAEVNETAAGALSLVVADARGVSLSRHDCSARNCSRKPGVSARCPQHLGQACA